MSRDHLRTELMEALSRTATSRGYRLRDERGPLADAVLSVVQREVDAAREQAWDEGEADGRHNEHEYRESRIITNPYRQASS